MKNKDINRRHFITKLFDLIKIAFIFNVFPFLKFRKAADASIREESVGTYPGLTLRQIASGKVHHGNGRFLNPFNNTEYGNLWKVISWKLFHKNRFRKFYNQEREVSVSIDWEPVMRGRGLSITFIKHATVMIKDVDTYILVDPVFSYPFWFIKDFTPLAFDIKKMPNPHHVLITHGHYDHLDKPSMASLKKNTHIISPLGYNGIFDGLGMNKRTQLDWFEAFTEGKREITLLPCNHWTMRNPITGPNRSLWGSFLIKTATGPSVFIAGDTAYFDGFRELGEEFSIDLAIFNLGAYEPRWFMAPSHINPAETVKAFQELKAKKILIVHWGTFRLGDEPVHFPPIQIRRELKIKGLLDRLVTLNHGKTLFYKQFSGSS
jgi:N-acyl-phosphatidylethanolamine-hydrolysing phospholipase D